MAGFLSPVSTSATPDAAEVQRQQQLAQMLMAQSMQPMDTQVVNGYAVKRSPLEALSKVLTAYLGKQAQDKADDMRRQMQAAGVNDVGQFVDLLRGSPAIPAGTFQTGANEMGDEAATQQQYAPARSPDLAGALKMAMGSQNPTLQQAGGGLLSGMIAQLSRAPKWEPFKMPDGKGGETAGYVDVNSPNPIATFQAGGYQPAKREAVSLGGKTSFVNPYEQAGDLTHVQSPDSVASLAQSQQHWENLSPMQRYQLQNERARIGNEGLRLNWETGQSPFGGSAPGLNAPLPKVAGATPQMPQQAAAMPSPAGMTPPAAMPVAPRQAPAGLPPAVQQPASNVPLVQSTQVPPAEKAKLIAAQPQEVQKMGTSLDALTRLDRAAQQLSDHPGLESIIGPLDQYSSVMGVPLDWTAKARNARALQDTLTSQVGISAINAMREASKTGGAVGSVTEKEWPILQQSMGNLGKAQTPEAYRNALDDLRAQVQASMQRIKGAYESTYGPARYSAPDYRTPTAPRAPVTNFVGQGGPTLSDIDAELARRGAK